MIRALLCHCLGTGFLHQILALLWFCSYFRTASQGSQLRTEHLVCGSVPIPRWLQVLLLIQWLSWQGCLYPVTSEESRCMWAMLPGRGWQKCFSTFLLLQATVLYQTLLLTQWSWPWLYFLTSYGECLFLITLHESNSQLLLPASGPGAWSAHGFSSVLCFVFWFLETFILFYFIAWPYLFFLICH